MSTDADDTPDLTDEQIAAIGDLSPEDIEALRKLARGELDDQMSLQIGSISRRDALTGAGALGLGALLGGGSAMAATGTAGAAPSTSDSDGDVGLPSDRVDVFADGVDSNSVETGEITNKNYVEAQVTATASSSYNADLRAGNYHKLTLTGDVTIDFTNPDGADVNSLTLHLVQDGTGGRTPSFAPTVVWPGGSAPSWSTAANAEDVVAFIHDQDGSQWLGFNGGLNFS